ncbi:MAG: GIY-YIG nuclease family protein [Halanaeroarchaeum sp.]
MVPRPKPTGGDTANESSVHHVYVLACADGTLYTGYTTDVERRVAEHNAGEGAKYTRGRTPVEVVHVESYETRSATLSREHEIKQLSRAEKDRLVED